MKRLQKIMKIREYGERLQELVVYAKELGVSLTTGEAHRGQPEDNIAYERILQFLNIRQSYRMGTVALYSAIASIFSAIAAWFAVLLKFPR